MQIRITGTKTSTFNFDVNKLKTALPKAFRKISGSILVPQLAYNAAYPGFATGDTYAQAPDTTLNVTGSNGSVTKIRTILPGNNYTVAPKVTIVGGGVGGGTPGVNGTAGVAAVATAGLNPAGAISLLTTGSGYTTVPAVTIGAPGAGGVQATAVATISGGGVTAINIVEPGSNYSTTVAPTVTIAAPGAGGVTATASALVATANTVGSITVTNGGSGYVRQPQVYITNGNVGGNGMGASSSCAYYRCGCDDRQEHNGRFRP